MSKRAKCAFAFIVKLGAKVVFPPILDDNEINENEMKINEIRITNCKPQERKQGRILGVRCA